MCTYTHDILFGDLNLPQPGSLRRGLVFLTGVGLLLISIITAKNMWDYFSMNSIGIYQILLLIFGAWGISYVVFLWISFFTIVIKKLPGCAWTGINQKFHPCVDTVLNAELDDLQAKHGISAKVLNAGSARLWIVGSILLLVFAYILTIDSIYLPVRLIMLGVISSLYFLYERSIHNISIGIPNLKGVEDYPRLLKLYLDKLGKRSSFKES